MYEPTRKIDFRLQFRALTNLNCGFFRKMADQLMDESYFATANYGMWAATHQECLLKSEMSPAVRTTQLCFVSTHAH